MQACLSRPSTVVYAGSCSWQRKPPGAPSMISSCGCAHRWLVQHTCLPAASRHCAAPCPHTSELGRSHRCINAFGSRASMRVLLEDYAACIVQSVCSTEPFKSGEPLLYSVLL
mgnify:CR=1 FL=1